MSDATGGSATVCGFMFVLAIPSLYCMVLYIGQGVPVLIALLVITGLFVNGPYALITTAVSADLGTRPNLVKNTQALATVVAVIDGAGSLGSALGPLAAGLVSQYGWRGVFYLLIGSQIAGLLCLTRLICQEVRAWITARKQCLRHGKHSQLQAHQLEFLPENLSYRSKLGGNMGLKSSKSSPQPCTCTSII